MAELILVVGFLTLYLLPWLVASARRHPQTTAIAVLTVLGGWTGVGWLGALVWAVIRTAPERERSR